VAMRADRDRREVACRAGARTTYGYGSDVSVLGRFGWFVQNSSKHVHPPRELRPSVRGLFDLHGNLFEWSHDWYREYGVEASTDPLGAKGGSVRVLCSGSWYDDAASCRSAHRICVRADGPRDRQQLSPGPESVWSLAGGGVSQGNGAIGRRHGKSVCGAETGAAVARWRSGLFAIDTSRRMQGGAPQMFWCTY